VLWNNDRGNGRSWRTDRSGDDLQILRHRSTRMEDVNGHREGFRGDGADRKLRPGRLLRQAPAASASSSVTTCTKNFRQPSSSSTVTAATHVSASTDDTPAMLSRCRTASMHRCRGSWGGPAAHLRHPVMVEIVQGTLQLSVGVR
jgi:hypothetical protein